MMKVRACKTCPLYDRELSCCRMGFVNPRTKRATEKVMATYSSDYICHYNRWKNASALKYQLYL